VPVGPPGQPWSRPLVTFLGVPPFLALIETVTIAVHLQNMNVVGEAVEQCPRQAFGAEHFGPLVEGKIASQQCGATLITLTEHLKQKFSPGFAERHEAEFVDDQQLVFCKLLLEAKQALLVPGLHQLVNQRRRRDKANAEAFLTGGKAETEGYMRFASA